MDPKRAAHVRGTVSRPPRAGGGPSPSAGRSTPFRWSLQWLWTTRGFGSGDPMQRSSGAMTLLEALVVMCATITSDRRSCPC